MCTHLLQAYLFGGCGGSDLETVTCLNDVYVFDFRTHAWDRVNPSDEQSPLPRASFGMCAGPEKTLVVAGGTGVEMDSLRADVMEFNPRTRKWRQMLTNSEATPCKLYGQSVCTYGELQCLP